MPYVDPWTTPSILWLAVVGLAALVGLRRRPLAVVAASTSALIAMWKAWAIGPPSGLLDLTIYTGSARAWLDGSSLFSYHSPVFNLSATYPPIGVIPFGLLSPLPAQVREVLFTIISLGAIAVTARCTAVLAGIDRERRVDWSLWAFALAIVTMPIWLTLRQGQINAILWALVIGDIVLLRRGSRFAGVSIGIATAVKLVPGLFIVWMVLAGLRRPAARSVVTALAMTGIGWVLAPSDSRTYWTDLLWHSERVGQLDDSRNNSLLGSLAHLLEPGPTRTLLWAALGLLLLVVGLRRAVGAQRNGDWLAAAVIVGCLSALLSPISWTHHLGYLVLALAAIHPLIRSSRTYQVLFAVGLLALIDPGHLGDDVTLSMIRMALMVMVVMALPIVADRSGKRVGIGDDGDDSAPADQAARTPRSRSTNS
jgi:alpha-1,2-mannosyltransferase